MSRASAAVGVLHAVCETIRTAGEIPAGELYAVLMAQGCTLAQFNELVKILTGSGLVSHRGDLLRWIGPKFKEVIA